MAFLPISTRYVAWAVDHYVAPLLMLWFAGRWFFLKAPTTTSSRPPDKMEKATYGGAWVGLIAAICAISAWHWWNDWLNHALKPNSIEGAGVLWSTAAGIAAGVITAWLPSPAAAPVSGATPVADQSIGRKMALRLWLRAAGVALGTAGGLAGLLIYPANRYAHDWLLCAFMALLLGYRLCCLVKDLA